MASSNSPSNDANVSQESADNVGEMKAVSEPYEETKEYAEIKLNISGELMFKLESDFSALVNALIVGKFGQELTGLMTNFLECAICKELIIEAVFRNKCEHTFCRHCLIHWTKISLNCPICREKGCISFRNQVVDGVVNLLVDLTFNEDEKMERNNIIQQRALSSATVNDEQLAFLQQNMVHDPSSISAKLICRYLCIQKAWGFLSEIFSNEVVCQQNKGKNFSDDLHKMLNSFGLDITSLKAMLNSLPKSLLGRYIWLLNSIV